MSAVREEVRGKREEERERLIELRREQAALKTRRNELLRLKEYGTNDFMKFQLTHFQHRMVFQDGPEAGRFCPPAPVHYRVGQVFEDLSTGRAPEPGRPLRCIQEESRGLAKTTQGIHVGIPRALINGRKNLLMVCANRDEAKDRIQDLTMEITSNEQLRRRFPQFAIAKDDKGQWVSYTDYQIVFANGARLKAYPFGGKLRGSLWRGNRPDFVWLDDPEDDDMQISQNMLAKGWHWLRHVLLPALSWHGALGWSGTPLSPRCLMYRAIEEMPSWLHVRQPVFNEDGTPHWPEMWPRERCEFTREEVGEHAWQQEYMLNPLPDEEAAFEPAYFDDHGYDAGQLRVEDSQVFYGKVRLAVYTHWDSAVSLEPDADRTAIVTCGVDPQQNVYVIEVRVGRWPMPRQLDELVACHERLRPLRMGFEKSMLEMAGSQQLLRDHALPLEAVEIKRLKESKEFRIRNMAVHLRNGKVLFNHHDPVQTKELRRELLEFPFGRTVDIVDALEHCVTRSLESAGHGKAADIRVAKSGSAGALGRF